MKKIILCFCAFGLMQLAQAQKKKSAVKFTPPVVKRNVEVVNAEIPPPPPPPPPPIKVRRAVPPPPPPPPPPPKKVSA